MELRDIIKNTDFTAHFIDDKYRKIELSYKGVLLGVYNGKTKIEKIVLRSWVVNQYKDRNDIVRHAQQKKILMNLISNRCK